MMEAFTKGEDLHRLTASLVLGRSLEAVSKEDRQLAKALNFGLIYGLGAEGLRKHARVGYGLELTPEEAQRFRSAFFKAYPGLKAWHSRTPEGAVEVRTLLGRRRVTERFTEKLNTPVQGSGADGLKAALALLWEERSKAPGNTFPILAVHDEVVVEAPEEAALEAKAWLEEAMRRGMGEVLEGVPVVVEAEVYRDWGVTPWEGKHAA
jgi:DNA polymerase-1